MNTKPFLYQRAGASRIEALDGRVLLADEMGLGKSLQALLYAHRNPELRPVLIVCPASLKLNWRRECAVHFNMPAEVLSTTKPPRGGLTGTSGVYVINYDVLRHWLPWLLGLRPQLVILDECFPYDTLVRTDRGTLRIGDIVEKELPVKVLCFNPISNATEYRPVVRHYKNKRRQKIVRIHHEGGTLDCTENHKIWVKGSGFAEAVSLVRGDELLLVRNGFQRPSPPEPEAAGVQHGMRARLLGPQETKSFDFVRVESVEVLELGGGRGTAERPDDHTFVYCLEVEEHHNFFADGILVSNCHYCTNPRAKRTRAARALAASCPHVLALSGTPLTNRPSELWPVLNMVRPDLWPKFQHFADRFCQVRVTPWGLDYSRAKNLDVLHEELTRNVMIRRLKKDVLKQLPAKRLAVVPMELDDPAEYARAVKDFLGWLAKKSPTLARRAARAEKLVKIGYLKRLAARQKLTGVFEWVDNFLAEDPGKLVLFAVHKEIITALTDRYKKLCVVVDGGVTGRDRQLAVDRFQRDVACRLFVGNIKAAGVGLTLTASSTVAFAELGWTPGEHTQAADRVHRIGQTETAVIYYLVAAGTVEERLCEILQSKMKVLTATLNGEAVAGDLDVFDRLEQILVEEAALTKSRAGTTPTSCL